MTEHARKQFVEFQKQLGDLKKFVDLSRKKHDRACFPGRIIKRLEGKEGDLHAVVQRLNTTDASRCMLHMNEARVRSGHVISESRELRQQIVKSMTWSRFFFRWTVGLLAQMIDLLVWTLAVIVFWR